MSLFKMALLAAGLVVGLGLSTSVTTHQALAQALKNPLMDRGRSLVASLRCAACHDLPKDVAATIHRAVHDTLNDPATKKALTDLGVDVVNSSPEALRDYIKSEIPKWAKVVKASGATAGQ